MSVLRFIMIGICAIVVLVGTIILIIIYVNNKALRETNERYRQMIKKKEYEDKI